MLLFVRSTYALRGELAAQPTGVFKQADERAGLGGRQRGSRTPCTAANNQDIAIDRILRQDIQDLKDTMREV